jgi:hypothetical protein
MKTVSVEYGATFVAIAQSLQYFSTMLAPTVGTILGNYISLGGTLFVIAVIRLAGLALFAFWNPKLRKKLDLSENRI